MHSTAGASQCYFCGAGRPSCPDNVSIALCPGIGYGQQWSVFSDEWGSEGSYSCLLENDDAPENWMSWGLSVLWCPQQNSAAHLLTTASRSMPVLSIAQGRAIDPENTSVVSYALSLAPWATSGDGTRSFWIGGYQGSGGDWHWVDSTSPTNLAGCVSESAPESSCCCQVGVHITSQLL